MTVYIDGFGKITASKEVLNSLSCLACSAEDYYDLKGYDGLRDRAKEISYAIYAALDDIGFYDNVR